MRKLILILASIAGVAVIAFAVYLSQLPAGSQSSGTGGGGATEIPGDGGKPGEAPKN